jgi:CRP-like cAMP-binding protein
MLQQYPDIAGKFLEILSMKFEIKTRRVSCMLIPISTKRIAEALLQLFKHDNY